MTPLAARLAPACRAAASPDAAALALAILVAFWARWHGIAADPLWFDELLTWRRATRPPAELIADAFSGAHYPLYFLLVAGWVALFGDAAAQLRAPSVLFGTLAVPVAFLVARDLAGRAAGHAAAVLTALSPFAVTYAQEARPYALAMLLVLVALWGQVRLAQRPGRGALGAWAAWVGGTAGALITLKGSVLWLAASLAGFVPIRAGLAPRPRRLFDRALAAAAGAVALVWLPWLAGMAGPFATRVAGYWVRAPSLDEVAHGLAFAYLLGRLDPVAFRPLAEPVAPLGPVVLALAVTGALALRGPLRVLMLAAALAPPVLLLAAGLVTPVFVPRYLFAGVPAVLVLAGAGAGALIDRLGAFRPAALAAAAAVALAAGVQLAPYYDAERKPRWDLAAEALLQLAHAEDRILFGDGLSRLTVELTLAHQRRALDPAQVLPAPEAAAEAVPGRLLVLIGRSGQHEPPDPGGLLALLGEPALWLEFGRQVRIAAFGPAADRPGETRSF
jgi:4-amino-4-deoxy-L-arabinose transferase-like glycosyltransferase